MTAYIFAYVSYKLLVSYTTYIETISNKFLLLIIQKYCEFDFMASGEKFTYWNITYTIEAGYHLFFTIGNKNKNKDNNKNNNDNLNNNFFVGRKTI